MKPHYLAIPAAVELYPADRAAAGARRFSDPIPWSIGAVARGASRADVHGVPEYGRFVMPLAVESYAPIGDAGWRQVLTSNVMAPTLLALLIFGAFAIFLTKALAARALLAFGIGAALSAIAQAKGWPYHVLPALSAAILLATFTLSQTIDRYLPISRSAPSPAGGGDLGDPDGAALFPGRALHAAVLQAAPVRGIRSAASCATSSSRTRRTARS